MIEELMIFDAGSAIEGAGNLSGFGCSMMTTRFATVDRR